MKHSAANWEALSQELRRFSQIGLAVARIESIAEHWSKSLHELEFARSEESAA